MGNSLVKSISSDRRGHAYSNRSSYIHCSGWNTHSTCLLHTGGNVPSTPCITPKNMNRYRMILYAPPNEPHKLAVCSRSDSHGAYLVSFSLALSRVQTVDRHILKLHRGLQRYKLGQGTVFLAVFPRVVTSSGIVEGLEVLGLPNAANLPRSSEAAGSGAI